MGTYTGFATSRCTHDAVGSSESNGHRESGGWVKRAEDVQSEGKRTKKSKKEPTRWLLLGHPNPTEGL